MANNFRQKQSDPNNYLHLSESRRTTRDWLFSNEFIDRALMVSQEHKLGQPRESAKVMEQEVGDRITLKPHPIWLRGIFITAVLGLSLKLFDSGKIRACGQRNAPADYYYHQANCLLQPLRTSGRCYSPSREGLGRSAIGATVSAGAGDVSFENCVRTFAQSSHHIPGDAGQRNFQSAVPGRFSLTGKGANVEIDKPCGRLALNNWTNKIRWAFLGSFEFCREFKAKVGSF